MVFEYTLEDRHLPEKLRIAQPAPKASLNAFAKTTRVVWRQRRLCNIGNSALTNRMLT